MKAFILVNSGLESNAKDEVKEILQQNLQQVPEVDTQVINFTVKNKEELLQLFYHSQSARRILINLCKFEKLEDLNISNFNWKDFFTSELSFKVEVENLKGNTNRLEMAKKVAGKIYTYLEKLKISPKIDLKRPDLLIVVYFTGKEYYLGIDFSGIETNAREYRLFTNSSSFKGDYAYHFVRISGFKPTEKLLVAYMKDGTIAIEAGLFASGKKIQSIKTNKYSFSKFPLFAGFDFNKFFATEFKAISPDKDNKKNIFGFDENMRNVIASKKNSVLAGVRDNLELSKYALDELDVKFEERFFDRLIFQITTKDEDKLNELYYQSDYILKPKGTLLLLTREKLEVSISSKFKLLKEEIILRGESKDKLWLLEKK